MTQVSIDNTTWYDRIWAAFMFFTRLPFWRLHQPDAKAFQTVVEHWPLVGWLTGASMAAVILLGAQVFPYAICIVLAMIVRMLLTGALHEDGLADFIDGFGGGQNRQRILDIMKDSHIGTYGVIGLIGYFSLFFLALYSMSPTDAALTVAAADPFAKMISAQLIQMLPYARTEETAKNRSVYRKPSIKAGISLALQGLPLIAMYIYYMRDRMDWALILFLPALVMYFLYLLMDRKLHGYTGDCCGATFLLVELTTLLTACHYLAA